MTLNTSYCTLAELKHPNRLNIPDSDSYADDLLTDVIDDVSRLIDAKCRRRFGVDSDEVARYYVALKPYDCFVDDIASSSSDVTVEIDINGDGVIDTTFAVTDFFLAPYNAETLGVPYQKIEAIGQYSFPVDARRGVKVTAKWGWASVPRPVHQACLLQCERIFKRASTPLGSQSMTALGQMTITIPSLDPDVEQLLSRYVKPVFG